MRIAFDTTVTRPTIKFGDDRTIVKIDEKNIENFKDIICNVCLNNFALNDEITILECKHEFPHPKTYEEIPKMKTINCGSSASITYQQAGIIPKGRRTGHTARQNKDVDYKKYYDVPNLKKSLLLSFYHPQNFKKDTCDFVKVMKKFDEMPDWLKQKGIMYVQDSNICISAGKGNVYSCNSTGHVYGKGKSKVLRTDHKHEVAFRSLILWAVVPRSNGKSNVPKDTDLKHLACGL